MVAKRLVEILAIGAGINGVILTLQGSADIGLVLGVISIIASFTVFFVDFRKRGHVERWHTDDF